MGFRRRACSSIALAAGLTFVLAASSGRASAQTLLWTRTYNSPDNRFDAGVSVAVSPDGSVYVAGDTVQLTKGLGNILLRKYSPEGAVIWTRRYDGPNHWEDYGTGVAVAADGSVYVSGGSLVTAQDARCLLRKYSPTGDLLWMRTRPPADPGVGVAVVATGGTSTEVIYVSGGLELLKYSSAGELLWTKPHGALRVDRGYRLAAAADGSVCVLGETLVDYPGPSYHYDKWLRKYSPAGELLWTKPFGGGAPRATGFADVAAAPDGSFYVTGTTRIEGQPTNLVLRKYSATGTVLWTRSYHTDDGRSERGRAVAVASDGSVFALGLAVLLKYSPDGARLWTLPNALYSYYPGAGLAADRDGAVYATGAVKVPHQGLNLILQKFQ